MNTLHPYTDEDNGESQDDYANGGMLDNYGVSNHLEEGHLNPSMLPPDDESLQEFELWNHPQDNNKSSPYDDKRKSRSRYEEPQETGSFNEKQKQWEQRHSNVSEMEQDQRNRNYNLNKKNRQINEGSEQYQEDNQIN